MQSARTSSVPSLTCFLCHTLLSPHASSVQSSHKLEITDIPQVTQQNMANTAVEQLLLFDEGCMTVNRQQRSFNPLTIAELPKQRDMVSLDAEFVCLGIAYLHITISRMLSKLNRWH